MREERLFYILNKEKHITLGSLFDGIGGLPYAGSFFGIEPMWASEIMEQAVSVTMRHMPNMKHVGDITKLNGGELPPVDIITFGSPCQDLSTAGKRAGIGGERSSLFYEAIRIIDEMREATNGKYPRYAVWENVPGALSSGTPRGSDYKAVLEAFTKTEIPIPRSGVWANAGMVRGNGVDLAWCVYNAQHFGVPQRRRRIFLVCDFGGRSSGEILFVAKSLSGYFAACGASGQGFAADAVRGADGASLAAHADDIAVTLFAGYGNHWNGNAGAYDGGHFALSPNCLNPWENQQLRVFTKEGKAPTFAGADGGGGRNPGGLVMTAGFCAGAGEKAKCIGYEEECAPTIKGGAGGFQMPTVVAAFMGDSSPSSYGVEYMEEAAPALKTRLSGTPCVCEPNLARTLTSRGDGSPNVDGGPNIVAVPSPDVLCVATGQRDAKTTVDLASTLTCVHEQPFICKAVGVRQNQCGDINVSDTAYSLATNGNASGRNAPLVCENVHAFSLDSAESNSMKSNNPHSGCREVETARTLDTSNPSPTKNQGGIAVVEVHPEVSDTLVIHANGITEKGTDECYLTSECHAPLLHSKGSHPGQGYPAVLIAHPDICGTLCVATAQANAEIGEELCPTITEAAGKSGNNKPYIVHPIISGTLCASGAGLSRPGGMASEPDLCIVVPNTEPKPTQDGNEAVPAAYCLQGNMIGRKDYNGPKGSGVSEDISFTLTATDVAAVAATFNRQRSDLFQEGDIASTQTARQCKGATDLVCQKPAAVDCRNYRESEELSGTLQAKTTQGYSLNYQNPVRFGYIVRRLLPVECKRLQGYPDGWTEFGHDGKSISDTRRYQMLGNSVAIPCVAYILMGIAEQFRNH